MNSRYRVSLFGAIVVFLAGAAAWAHVTPPRVLMTDLEAAQLLLPEARSLVPHQLTFSLAQRKAIQSQFAWRPGEKLYRYYVGREEHGRLVGTVVLVGEITVHGLVRTAVALDPQGKIKGAAVVAVTDECYTWVKPHIDRNFARDFVGKDSQAEFAAARAPADKRRESMVKFYGQVLVSLLRRGAILYRAGNLDPGAGHSG